VSGIGRHQLDDGHIQALIGEIRQAFSQSDLIAEPDQRLVAAGAAAGL